MSLHDRFTDVLKNKQTSQHNPGSLHNQKLALQMESRPSVQAALHNKGSLRQRLGRANVKARLGGSMVRGATLGFPAPGLRGQGDHMTGISRPVYARHMSRYRGQGALSQLMGPRALRHKRGQMCFGVAVGGRVQEGLREKGRRLGAVMTGALRGRGRGRGRDRGLARCAITREMLDIQLDEYMSNTKSRLDAELDAYMAEVDPADIE
ncbi:chromatin target of PRMT1 protein-like [Chanos chanos]|uniref:Chromatin target of PRMT1 protein-like n=1 Tax=Chanos chanos TaxID=29144 RepID=A0A6J2W3Y9_CHACN|nr:chromatin target of PRMT1 protein-like [Chanos chanos]